MMTLEIKEPAKLAMSEQRHYYDEQATGLGDRWKAAVSATVASLFDSTERGARCRLPNPLLADVRWIFVKGFPFRLFYLYRRAQDRLIVVHILHEKRDIADFLEVAIREV